MDTQEAYSAGVASEETWRTLKQTRWALWLGYLAITVIPPIFGMRIGGALVLLIPIAAIVVGIFERRARKKINKLPSATGNELLRQELDQGKN
jgi:hypothetical protein